MYEKSLLYGHLDNCKGSASGADVIDSGQSGVQKSRERCSCGCFVRCPIQESGFLLYASRREGRSSL